ncbi:Chlorovirus glycoprotein repeat domain-containing protein, partial [Paramecium bursaria Chlorella virus IL-5-2s1]
VPGNGFFIGNGSQLTGIIATATIPSTINTDVRGNIIGVYANMTNVIATFGNIGNVLFESGNVTLPGNGFYFGNGSQLSGITATIPSTVTTDVRGNIIGVYANMTNVIATFGNIGNVLFNDGNVTTSGFYFGNGSQLSGITATIPSVLTADLRGNVIGLYSNVSNVIVSGQVNVVGNIVANTFLGNSFSLLNGQFSDRDLMNVYSTSGNYIGVVLKMLSSNPLDDGFTFIECDVNNGSTLVAPFSVTGRGNVNSTSSISVIDPTANIIRFRAANSGVIRANVITNTLNIIGCHATSDLFSANMLDLQTGRSQTNLFNFIDCSVSNGATSVFRVQGDGNVIASFANIIAANIGNVGIENGNVITNLVLSRFGNIANVRIENGNITGNVVNVNNVTSTTANIASIAMINGNILAPGDILATANISVGADGVFKGPGISNNAILLRGIGNTATNNQYSIGAPTGQMRFSVPSSTTAYYNFLNGTDTIATLGPQGIFSRSFDSSVVVGQVIANSSTYSGTVFRTEANRNSSTAFTHLACNGLNGNVFRVRGDGTTYGVGAFQTSGADYAEMMEWEDKNPTFEDRRGYPVVLSGNGKIRIASLSDDYNDIIGVVSSNPSMVADTAWDQWGGKYLNDKFGMKLSNTIYYLANISNENEFTRVGPDTIPPQGYFVKTAQDYILNPQYNSNVAYVERNDRPEWDPIGFVGKLRVRHGCLVHPSWKPIKVIDDHVDVGNAAAQVTEYLIGVTPNHILSQKVYDLEQTINVLVGQVQMLLGNI